MQKAAVVILNYNGKEMLRKFLPSVVSRSKFKIIITDNDSTDGSVEFVKSEYPNLTLLSFAENSGFTGGYNKVLSQLEGDYEYYILLNSDVEVSPDWDKGLIDWLDKNSEFAALQPKILSFQNPDFFDYAGAGGGFVDSLGYPYCRGRVFSTIEKDENQYDDEIEVDWASGACMAIRASVFHEVGGFDSRFFAHMEEIDICWRIKAKGYKIGYFGGAKVWHVGGATLSRTNPFKTHLNFRNNLLMLYKNNTKKRFIKIYLFRVILDAIAALSFLLNGNIQDSKEVLKAHLAFHKMKNSGNKYVLASKLPVQISVLRKRSILWDYYIRGWKTFNKI